MIVLTYLFELIVGLLTVLAIGATFWFIGAYILMAAFLGAVLFIVWVLGQVIVAAIKGTA